MPILQRIGYWTGITAPRWIHSAIARRNMPILVFGSAAVMLFAIMLIMFVFSGTPSPIIDFNDHAYRDEATLNRFKTTSLVALVILTAIFVYSLLYIRKKWDQPRFAVIVALLFSFVLVMLWGIVEAGAIPERQIFVFGSIQFLVAGLIVLAPLASTVYFIVTTILFGVMLDAAGGMSAAISKDLIYLGILDIVVSWIVYGLFVRSVERERALEDMSLRDELTGAKNRHYLRDDFDRGVGQTLAVMLCDIDDFKLYNDNYSHDEGDRVLREFYFALREAFGDECTYRYGGDEFLVVSPDFGKGDFEHRAQKVAKQLAMVEIDGQNANITFSGGYTMGEVGSQEEFRNMLHEADENLLAAKRSGKNCLIGT